MIQTLSTYYNTITNTDFGGFPISEIPNNEYGAFQQILPKIKEDRWRHLNVTVLATSVTAPIFEQIQMTKFLKNIADGYKAVKPNHYGEDDYLPDLYWMIIYSFIYTPFTLIIPPSLPPLMRYRPITIGYTQSFLVNQQILGESRDILYSCDYNRMMIYYNKRGEKVFGVKPEFIDRSTPMMRITTASIDIMGCFAITAVLPFSSIPPEERRNIDLRKPSTWKYTTPRELELWNYGAWKQNVNRTPPLPDKEIYITQSLNEYISVHELTPNPIRSSGTFYVPTPPTDPIGDMQARSRSTQPQLHFAPFEDIDGNVLTTYLFYPSIDFHFIEMGVTITHESSKDIVREACVPPTNVLEELDRISDHFHTPYCRDCGLNRMCGDLDKCYGPFIVMREVFDFIVSSLLKHYTKRTIAAMLSEKLKDFKDALLNVHQTYEIPANTLIDDFYSWFGLNDKIIPCIGNTPHFPVVTNYKSMMDYKPSQFCLRKKITFTQRRHISTSPYPSRWTWTEDDQSSSGSEDDDLPRTSDEEPPTKLRKLEDGSKEAT